MADQGLFKSTGASAGRTVAIEFAGRSLQVPAQGSVAAALLASGVSRFRSTPVSGAPRAPYCMMGACFDCLVEIDGVASRQACQVPVREGMAVCSQEGAREWPAEALEHSHAA